jgi:hypothetical protein
MIRTISIDKVPSTWIFEYYGKLTEKLHGQQLQILSIFSIEKTPSLTFFYKNGTYRFNCFSSGFKGDAVDFVRHVHNISEADAINLILIDFAREGAADKTIVLKEEPRYHITSHETRQWNELDAKFWSQFGIGSRILEKYNVKPLNEYVSSKKTPEGILEFTVKSNYVYGYFRSDGTLYKIYRPMKEEFRFLNVSPYVQGLEQLTYKPDTLIITSSLKDLLSLMGLDMNVESIAPTSENSMLARSLLSACSLKYKKIVTLFDNDKAGHTAMKRYEEMYNIPGIYLNLSKDLSDSIRDHGIIKTKQCLKPLIQSI